MPNTTPNHINNNGSLYHPVATHNNHSYTSAFPAATTIVRSCTEFSHERSHSSGGTVVSKLLIQPAHLKSQSVSHWPSPVSRNPGVTLLHASDHISVLPVRTIPVGKLKQLLASANNNSPLHNEIQILETSSKTTANANNATNHIVKAADRSIPMMIPSPPIIHPSSTSFSSQSASSPNYHHQQFHHHKQQQSSLGRLLRVAQPPPTPSYVLQPQIIGVGTFPSTSFSSSSSTTTATSVVSTATLQSNPLSVFNSVPSLSNPKTFTRSVASATALNGGMERLFQMSYDELLELAQNQQRQIETNEAELDERRKTVAQFGVAKRMAGSELVQQQQAKIQMAQIRAEIERDELELTTLSQCQRESRQLGEHNQRQCRELQQLETAYAQDDQQLRQAVQKVDSLRAQLELLYQRRAAAADTAITRQRQINGGRIGTTSGQQHANGYNMNVNKLASEQRPKASVSPFNKGSSHHTQLERSSMNSEHVCADRTDNCAVVGGQNTKKTPAQKHQPLVSKEFIVPWRSDPGSSSHNQQSQDANQLNDINNHHLLMPPASVDKISLRRNSINQAKRNSLLAESGDEQQQQMLALLLAEQRRGRTHVSFGRSWDGGGQQQFGRTEMETNKLDNLMEESSLTKKASSEQQNARVKGYSNGQLINARMEEQKQQEESEQTLQPMEMPPRNLKFGNLSPIKRTMPGVPPGSLETFNQTFKEQDVKKTGKNEMQQNEEILEENDTKITAKEETIEPRMKKDEEKMEYPDYKEVEEHIEVDDSFEETKQRDSSMDSEENEEDNVRLDQFTMKPETDDEKEDEKKEQKTYIKNGEENDEEVQLLDQICLDKPMGMEELELFEERQQERNRPEPVTAKLECDIEGNDEKLRAENVEFLLHQSPPLSVSSTDTSATGCCYISDEERILKKFDKSWQAVPTIVVGIKSILQRRLQHKDDEEQRNFVKKRVKFDLVVLFLDVAYEGQYDLLVELAGKIDNISVANSEGITALHYAICASNQDIVHFLIDNGADVNALDVDGWSPLHCAASCDNLPMLKLLIENGACPFATTISKSETAAQIFDETTEYGAAAQYMEMVEQCMGEVNEAKIYAAYTYRAQRDDELSFEEGDQLRVLRKNEIEDENDEMNEQNGNVDVNGAKEEEEKEEPNEQDNCERKKFWWLCEHMERGDRGLVPRNYLALFPSWKHRNRYQISFQLPFEHLLLPENQLDSPHCIPNGSEKSAVAASFTEVLTVPNNGNNGSKTNSLGHPELITYA